MDLMRACFVAVVILCCAGVAQAQTSADAAIDGAVALRRQGRREEALALLTQIWGRTHVTRALAQMGITELELGRWADSERHLSLALNDRESPWVDAHRTALAQNLQTVRGHLAPIAPTPRSTPGEPYVAPRIVGPEAQGDPIADGRRRTIVTLGWVGIAAAGAFGLTGVVSYLVGRGPANEYNSGVASGMCRGTDRPPESDSTCADALSRARVAQTASLVGYVGAGVLGAAGVALLLLAPPSGSTSTRRSAWACGVGPGAVGVACATAF